MSLLGRKGMLACELDRDRLCRRSGGKHAFTAKRMGCCRAYDVAASCSQAHAQYLRLLALKAGERPFLMRRHQSSVLEVNRLDFSPS